MGKRFLDGVSVWCGWKIETQRKDCLAKMKTGAHL